MGVNHTYKAPFSNVYTSVWPNSWAPSPHQADVLSCPSCLHFTPLSCVQKGVGLPWGIRDPPLHISVSWAHHIRLINPEGKELRKQDRVRSWVRERKGFVGRVRVAERKGRASRRWRYHSLAWSHSGRLYEFRVVVELVGWEESRKRMGSLKGTLEDFPATKWGYHGQSDKKLPGFSGSIHSSSQEMPRFFFNMAMDQGPLWFQVDSGHWRHSYYIEESEVHFPDDRRTGLNETKELVVKLLNLSAPPSI